jgi:radical SAM superfamily enzyme YgiQ (UPF0313 family)
MRAPFTIVLITPYGTMNSGLRLLAAVLRQAGFKCEVIFFGRWLNNGVRMPDQPEIDTLIELVQRLQPNLVGLGFGSPYLAWARWVLAELRDRVGAPTVAGGIHPTLNPEDLHGHADYVCVGEGETPLRELAEALRDGADPSGIAGLHLKRGLKTIVNPPAPLVENLDALPFRDFSDEGKYSVYGTQVVPGDPLHAERWLRVHGSRGCPFACAYCYNASLRKVYGNAGNRHRVHSVDWVIAEVKHLQAQLPKVRRIIFDDDTFVFPPAWLEEFCRRWPVEVGLPFDILAHPAALKPAQLKALRAAGLYGLQMGIQAASRAEATELYGRTGTDQTLAFAHTCRDLGIDAVYDLILDNPTATDEDREALLDLLAQMPRPYRTFLYSLNVFPQTSVADALATPPAEVEGRSQKSLRQFRLTLAWPRPPDERLFAALVSLASKPGVRFSWIRRAWASERLRRDPRPVVAVAHVTNWLRLAVMGARLLARRELAWYKLREYASPTRILTQ